MAGGVGGVEACGLVWEVGGLLSESDVGSELVLSGSVVGVGGPTLVWASWVGSARRAVLYASCWLALRVSSSVWVGVVLGLWVGGEGGAVWGVVGV